MTYRVTTGLPGLDAVLDGGFLPDRAVLVSGPPGAGKTTLLLHSLDAGVKAGDGGVLLCVDQRPRRVLEDAKRQGFELDEAVDAGRLVLIDGAPYLERGPKLRAADVLADIQRQAHGALAIRVAVDSLSSLTPWTDDAALGREFLRTFMDGVEELDCVALLTWCTEAATRSAAASAEVFASGVVDLKLRPREDGWRRLLCVRKMRGTDVQPLDHAFDIEPGGIVPAPAPARPRAGQPGHP
jgi:circadian clock protein KaiC